MYLKEKEERIIKNFLSNLCKYDKEEMKLSWNENGTIIAEFDTCFEDQNEFEEDETQYEEFLSFVFKVKNVSGNPPVFITEDEYFCVDYHNFPDVIMVGNEKIN